MPKRITAFIGAQREGRPASDEDSCTILLHYEGMMATVKASVISPEVQQLRYWVRGDKGSFKKAKLLLSSGNRKLSDAHAVPPRRPRRPTKSREAARRRRLRRRTRGQTRCVLLEPNPWPPTDFIGTLTTLKDGKPSSETCTTVAPATYAAFYTGFAKALAGEGEVPVKAEEASAVIRLIELARESSRTGRTLEVQTE